ncbi:hypothetical protein K439DRAFT_492205 [Ramaria rubella]|nr:hypothetical protein K439DRAFT_492205 [Ramaria rubella]
MLLHTAHLLNFLFTAYILRTFLGSQTFSKFSHFLVELPFYEQCIGIDTPHVPQSRSIIQTMSSPDASLNTPVDHWSSPSSDIPSRTFANELATFQFTNSVTLSSAPPPTVSAFRIAAAASAFVIVAAVVVSYSLIKRCSFEPSRMVQGSDPLPTPSKCQKRAGTTLGTPGSESLVTMLATLCMDSPLNARVDIVNAPVAVVNGEIKDPFESFGVASYPTSAIFGTIPSPGQGSSTIKDRTRSFSPYTLQPTADEGLQILLIGTTETLGDPDYETDSQSCQWKLKTPKSVRYTQLGRSTRSPTPRNRSRVEKTNAEDSSRCVFPRSGYIARPEETLVTATRKFKENSLQHVQVEDAPLAGITITPTSPQPISGTMEWDIPSRATAHPKHRENIPATVISSKADIASAEENRMSVTPENFE